MKKRWLPALVSCVVVAGCGQGTEHLDLRTSHPNPISLRGQQQPFACAPDGGSSLALTDGVPDERLPTTLASLQRRLPQGITPKVMQTTTTAGATHVEIQYFNGSIPVCELVTRAHFFDDRVLMGGEPVWHVHAGQALESSSEDWPLPSTLIAQAAASMQKGAAAQQLFTADKCWLLDDDRLIPALNVTAEIGGVIYSVLGDGQTAPRRVTTFGAHATGVASAYQDNPKTGKLIEAPLNDLVDTDVLGSSRFKVVVNDGAPVFHAADHRFVTTPDDPRFDQASLFAHAEEAMDWMELPEHGFSIGCSPIDLILVKVVETAAGPTPDNALYLPPSANTTGRPSVLVAPGLALQGLRRDFDVIAHELGHHVLTRTLKSVDGESRVIQEGLADYLVYAHTGDACLAESICTEVSGCQVPRQCLRTGDNDMKLDEAPERNVYLRASVLSGLMWELGKTPGLSQGEVARLVFKAVDYFQPSSGYSDLFKALLAADLELNGGSHACLIESHAVSRGFNEAVADLVCQDYVRP